MYLRHLRPANADISLRARTFWSEYSLSDWRKFGYITKNTPIQIYRKIHLQKTEIFQMKNSYIYHNSAQNINCGYSLEPPRQGGSNEYPQPMFLSKQKKNNVYPCKSQFIYTHIYKWGWRVLRLYRHGFITRWLLIEIQAKILIRLHG